MKTYLASLLAVSTLASSLAAPIRAAEITNIVRLTSAEVNRLVEIMRINHPALRAWDARVRAARHATNSVPIWGDPMLAFGGVMSDGARGPMLREEGDLLYGLEQPIPLFGKPASMRAVAQREAEVEFSRASMEFQNFRRDLANLLFTVAFQQESIEIGREDLNWLQTMSSLTEERYRAGTSTQVETLRVQNEYSKRIEALRTETLRRDQTLVGINRLLNRPFDGSLPEFRLLAVAAPLALNSNLVALAVRNEPRLRVLEAETRTLEAQVASTRKSRLPEVGGFLEGRQYSGDGGFREATIGVKLTLPWFNAGKYRSDLARDRARVQATQFEVENTQQLVREEIHRLLVEIDAARREAILYQNEILPRSRLALEAAHASWTANRGMFNDVMETRRGVLEARLMRAKAISQQHQAMTELILACGLNDLAALASIAASDSEPSSTSFRP